MRRSVSTSLLCAALLINAGCAAVAVTGIAVGALMIHDRRDIPAVIDDERIEIAAYRQLSTTPALDDTHVRVTSFNSIVLLTGEVYTEAQKRKAESLIAGLDDVRRVVNALAVQEPVSAAMRVRDSAVTSKVKTALFGVDIEGFDPSRVNVTTARGNVYLMGLVTKAEAEAVVDEIRYLGGVERIIKVFEYIKLQ